MSPGSRVVLLGHIGDAHGIRGEVVVRSYAADPSDIAAYGPLQDETGRRTFALTVLREAAKGLICRVAGVTDRTQAEALRGTALYIARERLPAAADGEFYHADLIGLTALDGDGVRLGRVTAVHNFGAGDLLEIALEGRSRTELVPFTSASAPVVDIAGGRLVLIPPEGLLASTGSEPSEDEVEGQERRPGSHRRRPGKT